MKAKRVEIEFSKDYANFKKGDSILVGRSLAHQLITVAKVAKPKTEVKSKKKK